MKILYFMHIDWHWIKQRPHFLAEELSSLPGTKVLVAYPRVLRRSGMVKNSTTTRLLPMPMLPYSRFKWISVLNEHARNIYLRCLLYFFRPDVVWLGFPTIVSANILKQYPLLRIVYDCMDDSPAFGKCEAERMKILRKENALLDRADLVLASSRNLFQKIVERGAHPDKVRLVRNAFGGKLHTPGRADGLTTTFRFLYIGTVADYIDFDVILHCLGNLDGIEFHFIGPITTHCPRHERVVFHEPVEHERLPDFMQAYDCFMMPFRLTELIRGVDPVKLYEYINLNKNILCVYYPELDRFSDFVTFYHTQDDFIGQVKNLVKDNCIKYTATRRLEFLRGNTWAARVTDMANYLRFSDIAQAA